MKKLFAVILSLGLILAPVPVVSNAHAGSMGGYAKMILGMANGIIGSTIITKCKLGNTQISILIYMAGGLIYTIAEIAGGKQKSADVENNANAMANYSDPNGGGYQKQAIQAQIDNEKSNLKHVQTKRKWMMATKIVYAAATAMAIVEIWWALPTPAGINKPFAGACTPNPAADKFMTTAISIAYGAFVSSGGSIQGMIMGAGMMGASKLMAQQAAKKAAEQAAKKTAETVVQVQAGTAAADAASVPLMNTAPSRIAFFAAATALVMLIDGDLKKEENDIKDRIAQLEKVRDSFEAADNNLNQDNTAGSASGATSGNLGGNDNDPSKRKYEVTSLSKGVQPRKVCATQNSGTVDVSESGCGSPLRLAKPTFPAGMDIPTLSNAANLSTDMANSLASGDIAGADVSAAKLIAAGAKIEAIKDNLMKKYNDQLAKEGKKPVDINGDLKRQVAALNTELNKRNAGSGNVSMSDIGDAGSAATSAVADAVDPNANQITTVSAPEAAPIDAGAGVDLSKLESEVGDTGAVDPNAGKVASLEDSLGQYESNESDISKDSGVSIFKQVSNRYILNYEKIFNRKQINPPLAEPQPSN